jgi:uncharacterized membrane protein
MKLSIKQELPLIFTILVPFMYLAYIWNSLPAEVPLHWNIAGEIDRYGDKTSLILIPVLLPLLIYVIFLIAPYIDPKDKIKNMGNKYQSIKTLLTIFMSMLALFILYSSKNQSLSNPNYIILAIGVLYIILGNYFKTIKANYFIGIRTPWTLENETVWKETHKIGGKLWFIGGLITVMTSLILEKQPNFIVFMIITGIITLIPVGYSYWKFKKLEIV